MKKMMFIISVLFCMVATGCWDNSVSFTDNIQNKVAQYVSNDAPDDTLLPRTMDISEGISDDKLSFFYQYDFDFDGINEDIDIKVHVSPDDDRNNDKMKVSIGNYGANLEILDGTIEAVYACDIDLNDGVKDLAIITCEVSSDPRVRILKYDPMLLAYKFNNKFSQEVDSDRWIGYAVEYYFNVNDDDTITIEEQTDSYGMWSVHKTYRRNESGVFAEVRPEYYEILPDFMENSFCLVGGNDYSIFGEEKEKWNKGYLKAGTDYTSYGFTINEGEYIKPVYDDGYNNIYVKKENGEGSWIRIDDESFERYDFNMPFFFLAG